MSSGDNTVNARRTPRVFRQSYVFGGWRPSKWNFLEKRACKTNPVVSFNLVNTVNFNAAPTLPSVCPYLVKSVAYRFTVDLFVCLVNIEDLLFKKCLRMRLSVDLL